MALLTSSLIILVSIFVTGSIAQLDSITSLQPMRDGTTLVSKGGSFELGFFSPGNGSRIRYLGIWYKKIPVQTVVWVVNRCNPISDSSGLLSLSDTGNLVLLEQNKTLIWSTKLSKQAKKRKVELLDSGNLVVREEDDTNSENYLWQSFDYPSDTLLPGMKLGWDLRTGLNRRLSAWKSWDDPCSSGLTWGIDFDKQRQTFPEVIMQRGTLKYHRSGPWDGVSPSGDPDLRPNPIFNFVFTNNDDEVSYIYNLNNESVMTRVVINETTSARNRFIWVESERRWMIYFSVPSDQCDNYNLCGSNGICIISEGQICQCLKGFSPKSPEQWSKMDWSQGCVRNKPIKCHTNTEEVGFQKFSGLKLPDTTDSWVNKDMSLRECWARCLSNCSCMAYSNLDVRGQGSGCANWFGDIMDIKQIPRGGQLDLYIRMSDSELVGEKEKGKDGHKAKKAVLIVVASICGSVSGVLFLGYCIWRRRDLKDRGEIMSQNGSQEEDMELPLFTFSNITTATDNFSVSNKLGEGGFGPVYKGKLENGQEIAVKRLSMSSRQGVNEFKNEVKLIAKLQHRNLVKLLGCCIKGAENLLVYEYMPNKSLDSFIFDHTQCKLLEWPKRFQIICGIARGLLYLHQDSRLRIVHRDLKASNVLLDKGMNPKISDFGMARIFGGDQTEGNTNRVVGTYGYMAPEYAFNGLFSTKSDVFSFGIMVLEILSGKKSRAIQQENHCHTLIGHAWTLLQEERPFELIDTWLRESYNNLQEVLRCIHVGLLCVQQSPMDRPNMSSVLFMLENYNVVLPQPKPPGYFMETESQERDHSTSKPEPCSRNTMTITGSLGR
ncbi:S-receptor-like serine/threonine-protein kinase [Parasponia andersonii]|uniref:Receptor-like serine/threonine-protein kinase n=1 Tax=Parasponia andersonii TaxID=3476 RepID=A0A2P5BW37_PARAD|nr:S-receptor-like serine/threonine-protein kinase [Parasponia andersonii]